MTRETGGLELASTIILILPENRLTKCASDIMCEQAYGDIMCEQACDLFHSFTRK